MSNENNPPTSQVGMDLDEDVVSVPDTAPVEIAVPVDAVEEPAAQVAEPAPAIQVEGAAHVVAPTQIGLPDEEDDVVGESESDEPLLAVFLRQGINELAELMQDPTSPLDPRRQWHPEEHLYIMPCTPEEFNNLVTNVRRLDPTNSIRGRQWTQAVAEGQPHMPRAGVGLEALTRPGGLWRQKVQSDGPGSLEISAGRPKLGERKGDAPLVGEEALQWMQAMMGTGQITRIPLWHSGIWVNLKAPTEAQLLELERRIANEKITLGRATAGLAYSNMSVYHNAFLFNFALSLVFDCSISGYTTEKLKQKILLPDLPLLLWGLLCTIYPNGYRYHRPCIADPTVCQHVTEELLDISKLCWTDNLALTASQRAHMVRKTAKFTDIELDNYVSQHRYVGKGTVLVKEVDGNKTVVELRVPTLSDYEQSGYSWVENIVATADQAFGSQLGSEERDEYILDQARTTSLRQYAHWIKRITFNGSAVIDDRSTLEAMIAQLTGDMVASEAFLDGVQKYINDSTISQIALPTYKCPACQADQQNSEEAKHPHLIPLDIGAIFFTLLGQRTRRLLDTAVI